MFAGTLLGCSRPHSHLGRTAHRIAVHHTAAGLEVVGRSLGLGFGTAGIELDHTRRRIVGIVGQAGKFVRPE